MSLRFPEGKLPHKNTATLERSDDCFFVLEVVRSKSAARAATPYGKESTLDRMPGVRVGSEVAMMEGDGTFEI